LFGARTSLTSGGEQNLEPEPENLENPENPGNPLVSLR
jgi:hypothetical protein